MRAIIKKKHYDTESATLVAEYSNGYDLSNFEMIVERLYLTSKKAWFLHGEGGANTSYARHHGNGRTGGERITPFDEAEAVEWLEQHNEVEVLNKYFAERIVEA